MLGRPRPQLCCPSLQWAQASTLVRNLAALPPSHLRSENQTAADTAAMSQNAYTGAATYRCGAADPLCVAIDTLENVMPYMHSRYGV